VPVTASKKICDMRNIALWI